MINKLKIGFLVMALSVAFVASSANAANISYGADSNIYLSTTGYTLTIKSGSTATSLTTNGTSFTVVIPTTGTFTIASNNNLDLTLNSGTATTSTTCSGTTNTMVITSTSTANYTITPNGGICNSNAGGGNYTPPADTTAPSSALVSINSGAASSSTLAVTLTLSASDSVGVSQMLVSNDSGFAGASWETYATSKSWTLVSGDGVRTVYAKFKDVAGNMSASASDSITVSGSATVAPVVETPAPTQGCSGGNQYNTSTGALCVNNAGAEIPGCGNRTSGFSTASGGSCALNRVTTVTQTSYNFGTTTLKNGSKGEAVKELQRFLNVKLSLGLVVDGKLGPKTIAVIKKWQKAHGLVADGLIGKLTKAKMNAEAE